MKQQPRTGLPENLILNINPKLTLKSQLLPFGSTQLRSRFSVLSPSYPRYLDFPHLHKFDIYLHSSGLSFHFLPPGFSSNRWCALQCRRSPTSPHDPPVARKLKLLKIQEAAQESRPLIRFLFLVQEVHFQFHGTEFKYSISVHKQPGGANGHWQPQQPA